MRAWCQAALLAPLLLLAACGTVRTDLVRTGTLALAGRPGPVPLDRTDEQDPLGRAEERLRRALTDEAFLEPGLLDTWQRWLGEQLGVPGDRVLIGAHAQTFPLIVPDGIDVALAWELEQPLALDRGGGQARVTLGWTFSAALLGDAATVDPDRLEQLAVATLAGHLVGALEQDLGWRFDEQVARILRAEAPPQPKPLPPGE